MSNVKNISLFLYVFLSFIGPTVMDLLRLIFLVIFISLSLIQYRTVRIHKLYLLLGSIIIFYNIILLSVSIVKYPTTAIIEAQSIIFYFSIYLFLSLFISTKQLQYIDKAIIASVIFISGYFAYILLGKMGAIPFWGDFLQQDYFVAASYTNAKFYALHLNSLTYLIPYIFLKTLYRDGKQFINIIALGIGLLTALLSLRRGIILSVIIGSFLAIGLTMNFKNIRLIRILFISFIGVSLILVSFHFLNIDTEKYFDTITSAFDFSNNRSNTIRTEQFNFLISKIKNHPIFGYGIGAYDPHYYRSLSNPANFELQYIKMIFASGFVGFFLNLFFVGFGVYSTFKLYKKSDLNKKMLLPAFAAWIAALVYNASNPLITQLAPFFMFFHIFYIINSIKNDQLQIPDSYLKQ